MLLYGIGKTKRKERRIVMEQYINKDTLVAKIKDMKGCKKSDWYFDEFDEGYKSALEDIFSFLDTLEVKELLTWQDIRLISEIGEDFMNSEESDNLNEEEYYQSILNKFKAQKKENKL